MSTFLQYPPSGGGGGGGGGSTPIDPTSSSQLFEAFFDYNSWNYSPGSPSTFAVGPMTLTFSAGCAKGIPGAGEGPGILTQTADSTNNFPTIYGDFTSIRLDTLTQHIYQVRFAMSRIPTSGADSWLGQWGLSDSNMAYNNSGNAVSLRVTYLSANFVAQCTSAGVTTYVDTGIPYAANTYYDLKVISTPTTCTMYVNGTLAATITSNIPTAAPIGPVSTITWQAGTSVTLRNDWIYTAYQTSSNR